MNNFALIFVLLTFFGFSQNKDKVFGTAVHENIKKYNALSNRAYEKGDLELGQYLFDTLVNNQLVGTKFNDYQFRKISGGKFKLSSIKKPIVLQTYSAWCVLNKGETPALNKLAQKYRNKLKIIVVFWDKKQIAREKAHLFNGLIDVCYANETYNSDEEVVGTLKYALGFLNSYYIDSKMNVVSIKKSQNKILPKKTPMKEAISFNIEKYEPDFTNLLSKE